MSKHKKLKGAVCRYCGCTDLDACDGGCSWVDPEETVCSACIGGPRHVIAELTEIADWLKARPQVRRMVLNLRRDVRSRLEAAE